jgi:hypothetical protein
MRSLEVALDIILPNIAKAKSMGVVFNTPDLIKMAANEFFIYKEYEDTRDNFRNLCYDVIREAALDLNTEGVFNPGDVQLK